MLRSRVHGVHDLAGHALASIRPYHAVMSSALASHAHSRRLSVGDHLRHWRQLRRLSQQDLALDAELSTRHLSCVETGKASPSRELVLRLCERLAVPLRERNAWLVAAGYAPMYREHALDDPAMHAARQAVQHLLDRHEPWPAVAFDRHWNLVLSNRMVAPLLAGVDPALMQGPVNLLRIACTRAGWHRASSTWTSGASTCSSACACRCGRPVTRPWPNCWPSCRPTPARPRARARGWTASTAVCSCPFWCRRRWVC